MINEENNSIQNELEKITRTLHIMKGTIPIDPISNLAPSKIINDPLGKPEIDITK